MRLKINYTTYLIAISGRRTCNCTVSLRNCGAFANSHVVSSLQSSGLQENFFCFLFHDWQDVQGISACFFISTIISVILRYYLLLMDRQSLVTICIQNPLKQNNREVAPRPGFGPGSCGRQPHILDLTILPGHKRRTIHYILAN